MNDDYLWDKSGEPDPEIQRLEEVLGALRYQPRPLEIPREVTSVRRKSYFPVMAIAAALLVALLAAGFWLLVHEGNSLKPEQAFVPTPQPLKSQEEPVPTPAKDGAETSGEKPRKQTFADRKRRTHSTPALTPKERQEAAAAKEQLMLALRVASEKLNLAQRRVQSPATPNQIRNQHKVG